MAGYGDARTGSASTLRLGGQPSMRARASGKVSGYAAGAYATAYADDVERLGAFADAWIQYGRYDNRISSDLGSASYRSGVWSASVETGYAFKPFAATSVLADLAVEPHVQLTHARYRASGPSCRARAWRAAPAAPRPCARACAYTQAGPGRAAARHSPLPGGELAASRRHAVGSHGREQAGHDAGAQCARTQAGRRNAGDPRNADLSASDRSIGIRPARLRRILESELPLVVSRSRSRPMWRAGVASSAAWRHKFQTLPASWPCRADSPG